MSERLRQFGAEAARTWVAARQGHWDHAAWLTLLEQLRRDGWADLDADAVGRILELKKAQYWRLRHWDDGGDAWNWVRERRGEWAHHEWMTLLAGLQCWLGPIDAAGLGELLERHRRVYREWRRWLATGAAARWVAARGGHWGHAEWAQLLESVWAGGFTALPADLIGATLEDCKRAYWRLRRWESSGEPYRWVEARRGRWSADDWRRLLSSLEASAFWPLEVDAVADVVERARRRYENLRRWQRSGAALLWVSVRRGRWETADWLELLAQVQAVDEVEPAALSEVLEELREQYDNVERWVERRSAVEERLVLAEPRPAPEALRRAA